MSDRKTPILLREGPLTGSINALTRYTERIESAITDPAHGTPAFLGDTSGGDASEAAVGRAPEDEAGA